MNAAVDPRARRRTQAVAPRPPPRPRQGRPTKNTASQGALSVRRRRGCPTNKTTAPPSPVNHTDALPADNDARRPLSGPSRRSSALRPRRGPPAPDDTSSDFCSDAMPDMQMAGFATIWGTPSRRALPCDLVLAAAWDTFAFVLVMAGGAGGEALGYVRRRRRAPSSPRGACRCGTASSRHYCSWRAAAGLPAHACAMTSPVWFVRRLYGSGRGHLAFDDGGVPERPTGPATAARRSAALPRAPVKRLIPFAAGGAHPCLATKPCTATPLGVATVPEAAASSGGSAEVGGGGR